MGGEGGGEGRGGLSLISIIDLTVVTNETPMREHKNNRGKQKIDKKKANFKNQLKSKLMGRRKEAGEGRTGAEAEAEADKDLMDSEIKKRKPKEASTKGGREQTSETTHKMLRRKRRNSKNGQIPDEAIESDRGGQVEPFE